MLRHNPAQIGHLCDPFRRAGARPPRQMKRWACACYVDGFIYPPSVRGLPHPLPYNLVPSPAILKVHLSEIPMQRAAPEPFEWLEGFVRPMMEQRVSQRVTNALMEQDEHEGGFGFPIRRGSKVAHYPLQPFIQAQVFGSVLIWFKSKLGHYCLLRCLAGDQNHLSGDRWNQPPAPMGSDCLSLGFQGRSRLL